MIILQKIFLLISLYFIFTQNINAQWTEQYSGDSVAFQSISAVDNNVAWLCGDIQRVYRTTNGGTNWLRCSPAGPYPITLVNIFGIDQDNALVSGTVQGERTYVFRTSNGGISWNQVFNQNFGFINSIWMTSPTNGFMQGDPVNGRWSLWRTNNGGLSWDSAGLYLHGADTVNSYNNSMYVTSESGATSIWFGTNDNRVYYSSNGGSNWSAQITPSSQYIYGIWFNSLTNGMRGGSGIYHTSNSGQNWSLSPSSSIGESGMTGEGNKWWCVQSFYRDIYYSSNNGMSWSTQFSSDTTTGFAHLTIPRSYTNIYSVWAVGYPGKIFKLNTAVGINPISSKLPDKFTLSQNYPKPL